MNQAKNYLRCLDCQGTELAPTPCFYYHAIEPFITQQRSIIYPAASRLRWTKADLGQVVTWSVNFNNSRLPFSDADLLLKSEEQFARISCACGIIFQFVPGINPTTDIEIFFEEVDGPGQTLAFVFQPSTGNNMSACGVCGPVHVDEEENFSLTDYGNVLLHELGHSVGLSHTNQIGVPTGSNVMDPTYSFGSPEFELGKSDLEQLRLRYPLQ